MSRGIDRLYSSWQGTEGVVVISHPSFSAAQLDQLVKSVLLEGAGSKAQEGQNVH